MEASQSIVNNFKFKNEKFDKLFDEAVATSDEDTRMKLLSQCDQIVIDEAAVIPILTDDHIVMINARVRNFVGNSMESLNLKNVFIKELRKAAEEE